MVPARLLEAALSLSVDALGDEARRRRPKADIGARNPRYRGADPIDRIEREEPRNRMGMGLLSRSDRVGRPARRTPVNRRVVGSSPTPGAKDRRAQSQCPGGMQRGKRELVRFPLLSRRGLWAAHRPNVAQYGAVRRPQGELRAAHAPCASACRSWRHASCRRAAGAARIRPSSWSNRRGRPDP